MKIVVVNGSPNGHRGVTAFSARFLQQSLRAHDFETLEVARSIRALERHPEKLTQLVQTLESADLVLWAFPVYVMLVPAQLKRFFELLLEHPRAGLLRGKAAAALSTSAHHYDHTAHAYVREVSLDLGLRWTDGFSAGLHDLETQAGRSSLERFGQEVVALARDGGATRPRPQFSVRAGALASPCSDRLPAGDGQVVVISDADRGDVRLQSMIDAFVATDPARIVVVPLAEAGLKGGCLGCLNCASTGECVYDDGYSALFEERVRGAKAVVYAGASRDHFFSSRMKTFFDRYFTYGHRPVLSGKAMGFLVSGPLDRLPILREVVEAHVEVSHCFRLGVVSDDAEDDVVLAELDRFAKRLSRWLDAPWVSPPTFRGFAADKNFRDLVYSHRGFMVADHAYYLQHGLYDFPQRDWKTSLFQAVLLFVRRFSVFERALGKRLPRARTRALERLIQRGETA